MELPTGLVWASVLGDFLMTLWRSVRGAEPSRGHPVCPLPLPPCHAKAGTWAQMGWTGTGPWCQPSLSDQMMELPASEHQPEPCQGRSRLPGCSRNNGHREVSDIGVFIILTLFPSPSHGTSGKSSSDHFQLLVNHLALDARFFSQAPFFSRPLRFAPYPI